MKHSVHTTRRGFTIIEIVMAVIIISVLTLVLTPTLTNRTAEARLRAAEQDLKSLADAEERAAVDTGYFYRPYVLNDLNGEGDYLASALKIYPFDPAKLSKIRAIRNNANVTDNLYINPTNIFINIKGIPDPSSGVINTGQVYNGNQAGLWSHLINNETSFGWQGPYVNWSRDANQNDWPDDPWGNDYLFFTQAGVIYAPIAQGLTNDQELYTDKSYQFQDKGPKFNSTSGQSIQMKAQGFDRPTWLSLGPNGLPGDGSGNVDATTGKGPGAYGQGDDIIFQFGGR